MTRAFSGAGDQIRTGDPHLGKPLVSNRHSAGTPRLCRSEAVFVVGLSRCLTLFSAQLLDFCWIGSGWRNEVSLLEREMCAQPRSSLR